jgi:hypothetical protein
MHLYNSALEIESVTLTLDKARELASGLLSVVEAIEFVSRPNHPPIQEPHSQLEARSLP